MSIETLRRLQKQHLMAIPYSIETVQASSDGIHLVELDEDAMFRTVVLEGRGGTCFQLNRLFCRLLSELGQDATLVAASTADGWENLGTEVEHMFIRVALEGADWLVDAGHPGPSYLEPLLVTDAALGSDRTLLVPAKLDLRGLRADATAGATVPPLLRGLARAGRQSARAAVTGDERRRLAERLAELPAGKRAEALLELVLTRIAVVLGYAGDHRVDADQGLFEIGFDSLTALELRNRLGELTGTKLGAGLVFDHPTAALIVAHLTERMYGEDATGPVALSV